jgi:hypothetical protein
MVPVPFAGADWEAAQVAHTVVAIPDSFVVNGPNTRGIQPGAPPRIVFGTLFGVGFEPSLQARQGALTVRVVGIPGFPAHLITVRRIVSAFVCSQSLRVILAPLLRACLDPFGVSARPRRVRPVLPLAILNVILSAPPLMTEFALGTQTVGRRLASAVLIELCQGALYIAPGEGSGSVTSTPGPAMSIFYAIFRPHATICSADSLGYR